MPRLEALEILLKYGVDIRETGPKLKLEKQPAILNAVNALGLGLNDAIGKLEALSTKGPLEQIRSYKQRIERNRLYDEIKTSIAMTNHVIKTTPSFIPDGVSGRAKYDSTSPQWNNYWSDVTKQFIHLESRTRLVRQRDKVLHLMARPKRLPLDVARFPISLPERVLLHNRLGLPPNHKVPQHPNGDWIEIKTLRNLLESDIAEVRGKIGWIDQTVLFDHAGPFL